MKNVLITGATGLIGSYLIKYLADKPFNVQTLARYESASEEALGPRWNIKNQAVDLEAFSPDIVIHLAGKSIADNRWNAQVKQDIIDSRVQGTKLLVDQIVQGNISPDLFICASAIGFYGNRGDLILNEDSESGSDFVSDVCRQWENELKPLEQSSTRVVAMRTGLLLSSQGGALEKMLLPFKLCLGGKLGSGQQYYSWISIHDMVRAIELIINNSNIQGPVNMTSPNPVRNAEFTSALGKVLSRPTILPMPSWLAMFAFGEMANELLLSSTRVLPEKLEEHGFKFHHNHIEDAIQYVLDNKV